MVSNSDTQIWKLDVDSSDFEKKISAADKLSKAFSATMKAFEGIDPEKMRGGFNVLSSLFSKSKSGFEDLNTFGGAKMVALGNIMSNIFQSVYYKAKSLMFDPIRDGFNEYEEKMKSIQVIQTNTLGKVSMDKIISTLDELNAYSDQTIYSFKDMTTNLGKFTASGVKLDEAAQAIKGISNLAAASGSSTYQASNAYYQLSQALASGRVNLQDWNSVVNAGMGGKLFQNALKKTAKSMGINIDASKSFRESMRDGWLTSEVLLKTLQDFAEDESMLKAATQVKSFSQLMDTSREALQSGWAKTWEYIIGDFNEAAKRFTAISDVISKIINDSADARNNWLKEFKKLKGFENLFKGLGNIFTSLGMIITAILKPIKELQAKIFKPERFAKWAESFAKATEKIKPSEETLKNISGLISAILKPITILSTSAIKLGGSLGSVLGGAIAWLLSKIPTFSEMINFLKETINGLTSSLESDGNVFRAGIIGLLILNFKKINKLIKNFKILEKIKGVFSNLSSVLNSFSDNLNSKALLSTGKSILLFATSLLILSSIKVTSLTKAIVGIGVMLGEFMVLLFIFNKFMVINFKQVIKLTYLLSSISRSILTMSLAITLLSTIESEKLRDTLYNLGLLFIELFLFMKFLTKSPKSVKGLTVIATSLLILSGSLIILSKIPSTSLLKAVLGLSATLSVLVLSFNLISKSKFKAKSMMSLSLSVLILSKSLELISKIKSSSLLKAVLGLVSIFGILVISFSLIDKMNIDSIKILSLSASIIIITNSLIILSKIKSSSLLKAVLGLVSVMTTIIILFNIIDKGNFSSIKIIALSISLSIIAKTLDILSDIKASSLLKSVMGLIAVLGALVIAFNLMNGNVFSSVGISVISISLIALATSLKILSTIKASALAISIISIGAALGILVVAGNMASGAAVGLLSLSVALLAIGVASLGISALVMSIGMFIKMLADAELTMQQVRINLMNLVLAIIKNIPLMAAAFGKFIVELLLKIASLTPTIVASGVSMLLSLLSGISNNIDKIAGVATMLVVNFASALGNNAPILIQSGFTLIIQLINGLSTAIVQNAGPITEAALNVTQSILDALMISLLTMLKKIVGFIPGMGAKIDKAIEGIEKNSEKRSKNINPVKDVSANITKEGKNIEKSTSAVLDKSIKKLDDSETKTKKSGEFFTGGFISGIGAKGKEVETAAELVGTKAIDALKKRLDEHSPSKETFKIGGFAVDGFVIGLQNGVFAVEKAAVNMGQALVGGLKSFDSKKIFNISKDWMSPIVTALDKGVTKVDKATDKFVKKLKNGSLDKSIKKYSKTKDKATINTIKNDAKNLTKETDKTVKDVRTAVLNANKKLDTELKTIQTNLYNNMQNAFNNAVKNLDSSIQLFNNFDVNKVSKSKLKKYLDKQVEELQQYQENMRKIKESGVSEEFVGMLYNQGLSAAGEIESISKMSADELKEYEKQYNEKIALEKSIASDIGITKGTDLYKENEEYIRQAKIESDAAIEEWKTTINNANKVLNDLVKEFKATGKKLGTDSVKGIIDGLNSEINNLKTKSKGVANTLINTIKDTLGIKSPSRVLAGDGKNAILGLIKGIEGRKKLLVSKSKEIGDSVRDSLNAAKDVLNENLNTDFSPVVKPVFDFSNLGEVVDEVKFRKTKLSTNVLDNRVSGDINFGDININITGTNSDTSRDLVSKIQKEINSVLVGEVMKLRRVVK